MTASYLLKENSVNSTSDSNNEQFMLPDEAKSGDYMARHNNPHKRQRIELDPSPSSSTPLGIISNNSNSNLLIRPNAVLSKNNVATMTKAEATAWRKEQRRIRNRLSAAASRQKVRNRIAELEIEVEHWKAKYYNAIDRLKKFEGRADSVVGKNTDVIISNDVDVFADLIHDKGANDMNCISPSATPPLISNDNISLPSLSSEPHRDDVANSNSLEGIAESLKDERLQDEELEEFLSFAFSDNNTQ